MRCGQLRRLLRLAAAGHTVFCDDILPVSPDDRCGVAAGIAPRLRIPLPARASAAFRRFVADHGATGDGRYLYLGLPQGRLAPRGTTAPIGAILLLERRDDGPALFSHAPRSNVMATLIGQNVARAAPAGGLLTRIGELADAVPRLVLTYAGLDEAEEAVGDFFSRWPIDPASIAALPTWRGALDATKPDPGDEAGQALDATSADLAFVRAPGIVVEGADGAAFLAAPDGDAIHHLNDVGLGVWNLLAEGISAGEAASALQIAFPDADAGSIEGDINRLFAALEAEGFIVPRG